MQERSTSTGILDFEPAVDTFLDDVLDGLGRQPRRLPCKYFYDERGSRLFDEICRLDEYYLTRAELEIMRRFAPQMAETLGPDVMLVEFGSGSSVKTRLLLDCLSAPAAYVPVDISREHLQATAERLSAAYPHLEILPVCADFTAEFDLPESEAEPGCCPVYFPGSTIGNFAPQAARNLLSGIASLSGTSGGLLIGVDLQKEKSTIEAAYNDARGVTAEFNLNLLRRINRELDADFDLQQFEHRAVYDETMGRVEISLVSRREQTVFVAGERFQFAAGEGIRTEYSHKYTIDGFARLAAGASLTLERFWTDDKRRFAVLYLTVLD